ncbi:hypothetical protein [Nitratifractor sp.]
MDVLDYFYELKPSNDRFFSRKLSLPERGSFNLHGARGCGKTALLLDWLRSRDPESWLYLDAQDPVFALEDLDTELLEAYLAEEPAIRTLVIDHWYDGFLERAPKVEQLVVVSRTPASSPDLERYELFPLDYEEFLGFDRSHSPEQAFSRYLKAGTLPPVSRTPPGSIPLRLREFFYEKFDEQESRLLLILARFQGRRVTTHQLYTYARESFRISKDWIYATIGRFREEKILLMPEYVERGNGKKLIIYDFILTRYLNKLQPFPVTFDAMVALALHKHGFPLRALGSLGYLLDERRELVVPSPFEGEEQFWQRAQRRYGEFRQSGARTVAVVTVSSRFSFTIGELRFEALPFYEWSILNE